MKKLFARFAFFGLLAVLLSSCTTSANKSAGVDIPDYATAEQIKTLPRCQVAVVEKNPCNSLFRTSDGKMFYIGSPAARQDVIQFLETLKHGQTCELPSAFLDYEKKQLR